METNSTPIVVVRVEYLCGVDFNLEDATGSSFRNTLLIKDEIHYRIGNTEYH